MIDSVGNKQKLLLVVGRAGQGRAGTSTGNLQLPVLLVRRRKLASASASASVMAMWNGLLRISPSLTGRVEHVVLKYLTPGWSRSITTC